ncbi:Uncharacterized protein OBRU01_03227 [Operophtera brumata]|uniref:Leucine zipper with capping helix domain-containing protein n=1 Tax=Operophtera brumata TaxID=104452 RepID=A0A0L7LRD7_OPEBR|nr:Uncharacterized protein OBRU01_03227 [Operophtera brumata]
MVDSEKIGTSIYFWSFPSKAKNVKKRKLNDLQSEMEDLAKKLKKTEDSIVTESDLKPAINRWTENIYTLKSYIKNTFQMENDVVDQSFGIPAELDYVDP